MHKAVGNRDISRSVEGRGMGVGVHRVNKMDITWTFRKESRKFERGWINRGIKDQGFGWGKR